MAFAIAYALLNATSKLLLLSVCILVAVIIYQLFLHPLARIPGPKVAVVSNIWHAYHARNGRMMRLGRNLHKQYGSAVRVGPNEVWFNSRDAFSMIYSATQGFEKSSFYIALALNRPELTPSLQLALPDTLDLLGEFDMERYRLQRRLIGPIYQKRNLSKYEETLDGVMTDVIKKLRLLSGAEVDLKEWMHIITVECLGATVLTWSPGYLRANTDYGSSGHSYLGWRRKSVFGLFPFAEIVDSYSRSLGRIFAKLWGLPFTPPENFKPFFPAVGNKTSRRINTALRPKQPHLDKRRDLANELIELHKSKPEFKENYLRRMVMTNFGAGHETTTSALTSVLSMLGSHPETQDKVRRELIQQSCTGVPMNLQYLQASIKEAQRLYPVIGMSLPRTVPASGAHIDGYYLPPGTTVGCNPIALHRNRDIFDEDAEQFRPERWLDEVAARDMDRHNLTWGGGARTCPGRNLAEMIVSKVVSRLVKEFEMKVSIPSEDHMRIYFMAMLTGVKVRFLPKDQKGSS